MNRRGFLRSLAAFGIAANVAPSSLVPVAQGLIPIGQVFLMADRDGNAVHAVYTGNGLIPCEGQALSRSHYPELFAAIGTAYGGGLGMFNVPDLRSRFT
jgi:hypothetical protein